MQSPRVRKIFSPSSKACVCLPDSQHAEPLISLSRQAHSRICSTALSPRTFICPIVCQSVRARLTWEEECMQAPSGLPSLDSAWCNRRRASCCRCPATTREKKKEESGPIMGLGGIIFRFGFGHYGWLLSCRFSSCSQWCHRLPAF